MEQKNHSVSATLRIILLAFNLEPKELCVAALHIGGNAWWVELRLFGAA